MSRWMGVVVLAVSRMLPPARRDFVEAMVAETPSAPSGWGRAAWALGSVWFLTREVVAMGTNGWRWTVRVGVVGAVGAVAALTFVVIGRYPEVGQGAGTALYTVIAALLLAAYLGVTFALTRADTVVVKYGVIAGLAAALGWTLGMPAGSAYAVGGPAAVPYLIGLVIAFAGPPVVAAVLVTRRTGAIERGVATGAVAGMCAALVNLIGGLVLVMALPGRVPMDSDVLARHHTATEILGANVGEDLVAYVGLLIGWPVAAAVLATVAGAITTMRRSPSPGLG